MSMKGCRRIRIVGKENREQQKARNDIALKNVISLRALSSVLVLLLS